MRRLIELVGLNGGNNAPGQIALSMGLDFIRFFLDSADSTATAAQFTTLRLFGNGDLFREYSGAQQDAMNLVDKIPNIATQADGVMEIPMEMLGMKKIDAQYSTTLCTFSPDPKSGKTITSARLELVTAGIGAPAFRIFAEVDDSGTAGPGWIERINQYGPFALSTSEGSISAGDKLPYGTLQRQFWRRIFFNFPGHNITLMRILRGSENAEILKMTNKLQKRLLAAGDSVRTATDGTIFSFVWDTGVRGISEPVDTIKSMQMAADGITQTPVANSIDLRLTSDFSQNTSVLLSTLGAL